MDMMETPPVDGKSFRKGLREFLKPTVVIKSTVPGKTWDECNWKDVDKSWGRLDPGYSCAEIVQPLRDRLAGSIRKRRRLYRSARKLREGIGKGE